MPYTVSQLLDMSQEELDEVFRAGPVGKIPSGEAAGTAIVAPGTPLADIAAPLVQAVAWQGKVFDPATGTLRNRVSPLGVAQIAAKVYEQESWFDGEQCIVLDYSDTSFVAQSVRDEIREVSPNLYLGIVFIGEKKTINFALEFGRRERRQGFPGSLIARIGRLFGRGA